MKTTIPPQRAKRDARRERLKHHVPSLYRPWIHGGANLLVAAIAVYLITRAPAWTSTPWWAYSAVPLALVGSNALEYLLHRFPMHRRYRAFKRSFTQHTVQHHRFYTEQDMEAKERRDFFFVLFPVEFGLFCLLLIACAYGTALWCFGAAFASVLAITLIGYVLALDGVHLICHLPQRYFERGVLSRGPFPYLMRLHRRHHNPRVMREVNFNITFPLMDWWVGTLDDGRERVGRPMQRLWGRWSKRLAG